MGKQSNIYWDTLTWNIQKKEKEGTRKPVPFFSFWEKLLKTTVSVLPKLPQQLPLPTDTSNNLAHSHLDRVCDGAVAEVVAGENLLAHEDLWIQRAENLDRRGLLVVFFLAS